jgi:hypothetical protein
MSKSPTKWNKNIKAICPWVANCYNPTTKAAGYSKTRVPHLPIYTASRCRLQSENLPMRNSTQHFVLHLGGQEKMLALATSNHTYFVFGRLRALRYCCRVFTALTLPCFTCESVKIMNTSTGFFIFFAHSRGWDRSTGPLGIWIHKTKPSVKHNPS